MTLILDLEPGKASAVLVCVIKRLFFFGCGYVFLKFYFIFYMSLLYILSLKGEGIKNIN